jgi:PhnB protein
MGVKAKPDGYHTATPYLTIKGAAEAIEFYKRAFGATEILRMEMSRGVIAHAEIQIGDSILMLGEECPQSGTKSPATLGGSPMGLMLYVDNVDTVFAQAVAAGAKTLRPVADQFYGDRSGTVTDPYGHCWTVATHIEDVSLEECKARAQKLFAPAA